MHPSPARSAEMTSLGRVEPPATPPDDVSRAFRRDDELGADGF